MGRPKINSGLCLDDGCDRLSHTKGLCKKHYDAHRYVENRTSIRIRVKNYVLNNPDKVIALRESYCRRYKEKLAQRAREHYARNREFILERSRIRYAENLEANRKQRSEYQKSHRTQRNAYLRRYFQNPENRMAKSLRSRVGAIIKGKGIKKKPKHLSELGCSITYFMKHIEGLFYPHPVTGVHMSWNNYGRNGWHLDHKIALVKFNLSDPEQVRAAFHYSNIQPLWLMDHVQKTTREGSRYARWTK